MLNDKQPPPRSGISRREILATAGTLAAAAILPQPLAAAHAPNINVVFHADLSDALPATAHYVSAGKYRLPLLPHTEESYRKALHENPELDGMFRYTHYTGQPFPLFLEAALRVHVRHTNQLGMDGEDGVSHVGMLLPSAGQDTINLGLDYAETARSFLFHHPEVPTDNVDLAAYAKQIMTTPGGAVRQAVNDMALSMRRMGQPSRTSGWALMVPFVPDSPDIKDAYKGRSSMEPTPPFNDGAAKALAPLLKIIKNDERFRKAVWKMETGRTTVTAAPAAARQADNNSQAHLVPASYHQKTAPPPADQWAAKVAFDDYLHGLQCKAEISDSSQRRVRLRLFNKYLRYLGAYIRFYDADGNVMDSRDWTPEGGTAWEGGGALQSNDLRYLGYVEPIDTILAIPTTEGYLALDIVFPERAVSASVYGGGIGTGERADARATVIGGILTGVVNFSVPTLLLGLGAAQQSYKPLYEIMNSGLVTKIAIAGMIIYLDVKLKERNGFDFDAFKKVGSLLFSAACTKLLVYVEAEGSVQAAADQIPFAGWIMFAINVVTSIAQMAMTVAEVATSPWLIEHKIATTLTSLVTLHPDPRNKSFPQGLEARSYRIRMLYRDENRPAVLSSRIDPVTDDFTGITLPGIFPGNTLGGQVRFDAEFYLGTWVAARATTGWLPNDEPHTRNIHLYLVQNPIPLETTTQYKHKYILTFDQGKYRFKSALPAPTATKLSADFSNQRNALASWTGLALSQRYGTLGFSWQAAGLGVPECSAGGAPRQGQLYTFLNVNIPGTPMDTVLSPLCGFQDRTRLVYDPFPPRFLMDKSGNWVMMPDGINVKADPSDSKLGEYFIDPSKSDEKHFTYDQGRGYHLRKISIAPGVNVDPRTAQGSWGRFPYFPDSVAMHPTGHIVAVNSEFHKLQVLKVESKARPDADVPVARHGSGEALTDDRPGLMYRPVAVACAYEGTIFVLEENPNASGVARISAFDLCINPVSRFVDSNGQSTSWLYLEGFSTNTVLDMTAVGDEHVTFLYVLYHEGDGADVSQYKMSVYPVAQKVKTGKQPLITVSGVAAAKLAVDMWHSAYTLNFAKVTGASHAVPSVSMWLPSAPKS